MAGERYRHIFLPGPTRIYNFRNPRGGSETARFPPRNRAAHAAYLRDRLEAAWKLAERQAVAAVERHGTYLEFVSEPGFDLIFESLENIRSGVRLLNVRRVGDPETIVATMYVPNEKRSKLLRKLTDYEQKETASGKPKNQRIVEGISDIRLCVLESFWNDETTLLPSTDPSPVEVWVSGDDDAAFERVDGVLRELHIQRLPGRIVFPERSATCCLGQYWQRPISTL